MGGMGEGGGGAGAADSTETPLWSPEHYPPEVSHLWLHLLPRSRVTRTPGPLCPQGTRGDKRARPLLTRTWTIFNRVGAARAVTHRGRPRRPLPRGVPTRAVGQEFRSPSGTHGRPRSVGCVCVAGGGEHTDPVTSPVPAHRPLLYRGAPAEGRARPRAGHRSGEGVPRVFAEPRGGVNAPSRPAPRRAGLFSHAAARPRLRAPETSRGCGDGRRRGGGTDGAGCPQPAASCAAGGESGGGGVGGALPGGVAGRNRGSGPAPLRSCR